VSDWSNLTVGPPQTGILLDTPPSPERRIADLEERLRQVIAEREQAYAKVANALESAKVRGEALERAEAKLAEISQADAHHPWTEIAAMPTVWDKGAKLHESVMRSFHVANEVRRLLELGTPPAVVLQVMNLLEQRGAPEPSVVDAAIAALAENSQVQSKWGCACCCADCGANDGVGFPGRLWACPWCGKVRCRGCADKPGAFCCDRGAQG
jgi:hypothetical protein